MKKLIILLSFLSFYTVAQVTPVNPPLPSQTGQSGKFLTTNGLTTKWASTGSRIRPVNNVAFMGNSLTLEGTYIQRVDSLLSLKNANWTTYNFGVSGDNTIQMRARFVRQVIFNRASNYVVIMGGTNDLTQALPVDTTKSCLQTMYTWAHNAGIKVVAVTITPRNAVGSVLTNQQNINNWIKNTAINVDYVVDPYTALADPMNPNALLPAYSSDGLHMTTAGYRVLGNSIYNSVTWINTTLNETALESDFSSGLAVGGLLRFYVRYNSLYTNLAASTSGAVRNFNWVTPDNTNQTAATAISGWVHQGPRRTWQTGNIIDPQIENLWLPAQYDFLGNSVVNTAYGNYMSAPLAGNNATITNSYALGTTGGILINKLSNATSFGSAANLDAIRITNGSTTLNSWSQIVNLSSTGTANAGMGFQLSDVSNSYGRISFFTRNADGFVARLAIGTGRIDFAPNAVSSGNSPSFVLTKPNNTGQNSSAAISGFIYDGGSRTWLNGAIALQKENDWRPTTYNFTATSTIAKSYGNYFNAPIAGTNATLSDNYAAGFNGRIEVTGNVVLSAAGNGLTIKEGTNAMSGTATLNGSGTVTVSNTNITATSRIFLTGIGTTSAGYLTITKNVGVGFTINSSSPSDARTVDYFIITGN